MVSGGPCIRSTVGNLVLEGLQLHCSADAETDVVGVLLDGSGVTGRVVVREAIIRLDGAGGSGERLAIAAPSVGQLSLEIRNTILYDLGEGTARHAGLLVEDDSVAAIAANVTVVGGEYGLRQTAGSLGALNVLVEGSASACFGGEFADGSRNNISSDGSAPGPGSAAETSGWLRGPLDGENADHHLACNPLSRAEVTISDLDIGTVARLFDGNTTIPVRTANVNPAIVELDMGAPVVLKAVNLGLGYGTSHRWTVAVADSASGSFRVIVDRTVDSTDLPDPRFVLDEAVLDALETAQVIRIEVTKENSDNYVHLTELELVFADSPCEGGTDLSNGQMAAFSTDIDSGWRSGPWDVGADEGSTVAVFSGPSYPEVWESEGQAVFEVLLSEPLSSELQLGYLVRPFEATEGVDYSGGSGEISFGPGRLRQEVVVPVFDDGEPDDYEGLLIEFSTLGNDPVMLASMERHHS